jgi:hypothetical protein
LLMVAAKILSFKISPPVTRKFLQSRRPVDLAKLLDSANNGHSLVHKYLIG